PRGEYFTRGHYMMVRCLCAWPSVTLLLSTFQGGPPVTPLLTRNPGRTRSGRRSPRQECSHRTPVSPYAWSSESPPRKTSTRNGTWTTSSNPHLTRWKASSASGHGRDIHSQRTTGSTAWRLSNIYHGKANPQAPPSMCGSSPRTHHKSERRSSAAVDRVRH